MDGLPEIPKVKHGLIESGGKSINSPGFFEDSGLDLTVTSASRPSTAGSSSRILTARSPSGSARLAPSPPSGGPLVSGSYIRPMSSLSTSRKSLDYIRIPRTEVEKNEQALTDIKSEVIELQAQIRNLQHFEEDVAVLQSACGEIGVALGCSVEGVAATALKAILLTKIHMIIQDQRNLAQQHGTCRTELECCKGEMAAVNVQLSSAETQLRQTKKREKELESDLKQARGEVEALQQTCARTGATVDSLREQLAKVEEEVGRSQKEASSDLTKLQTDLGRLNKQLAEKDEIVRGLEAKLNATEVQRDSYRERVSNSEAMYDELGIQLASALGMDSTGSFDLDHLLSKVSGLLQECEEVGLRCETLGNTLKTAELDSKASRETILRLVSQTKQQEKASEEVVRLKHEMEEQRAMLAASDQEKEGLVERLTTAKETVASLEHELQAKEERLSELCRSMNACKLATNSSKLQTESIQAKYNELVKALSETVSVESLDTGVLLQTVANLIQNCSRQSDEVMEHLSLLKEREISIKALQDSSGHLKHSLEKEQLKVSKLEEETAANELVKEGLTNDLEKCRGFYRKVARALKLDNATTEILAGDFAYDAILMKAEQLAKHENEALLNKQTAVYSLQRKLKACRQTLESRELHLSLLQKKVEALQQKIKTSSHKESEMEAAISKMKTVEKQLDHVQGKVKEQKITISQLQSDSNQLQNLKEHCHELEREREKLIVNREEQVRICAKHSKQLAEARERAKQKQTKDTETLQQLKYELAASQDDIQKLKVQVEKLSVFKTAVQRLLTTWDDASSQDDVNPSDYDLIASVEKLVASQQQQRHNAKCLEASLRQLELGFKSSYKDTLTLLTSVN